MRNFEDELASLLNSFSMENGSNTPDFILAQYLIACLDAFNQTSRFREEWYGRSLSIEERNSMPLPTVERTTIDA